MPRWHGIRAVAVATAASLGSSPPTLLGWFPPESRQSDTTDGSEDASRSGGTSLGTLCCLPRTQFGGDPSSWAEPRLCRRRQRPSAVLARWTGKKLRRDRDHIPRVSGHGLRLSWLAVRLPKVSRESLRFRFILEETVVQRSDASAVEFHKQRFPPFFVATYVVVRLSGGTTHERMFKPYRLQAVRPAVEASGWPTEDCKVTARQTLMSPRPS